MNAVPQKAFQMETSKCCVTQSGPHPSNIFVLSIQLNISPASIFLTSTLQCVYVTKRSSFSRSSFGRRFLDTRYIAVSIYCNVDMGFKIFDLHASNVYGRGHPQGTCLLLEALSLDSLVCYFQSLHNDDIF